MKLRKIMLAVLAVAIVAGITTPANAMMHSKKHHKRHYHHKK